MTTVSRKQRTCLAYIPWIALFSTVVVVIGLCIYTPKGVSGVDSINKALETLGVTYKQKSLPGTVVKATAVVSGTVAVLLLLLSFWRSGMEAKRDRKGHLASTGAFLGINGIVNTLFWCTIIWAIIAFGVCVTAGSAAYATDRAGKASASVIRNKLTQVRQTIEKAHGFVNDVQNNPQISSDSQLRSQVNELKKLLDSVDGQATTCPYYCLDLQSFSFLNGNRCICVADKLDAARAHARSAWQDLCSAMWGLLVAIIGSLWLLMNAVAQFSHTKADAKWSQVADAQSSKNLVAQQYEQHAQPHQQYIVS